MTLYAQAGELITCEAGHVVCVVARNLLRGQHYRPGDFGGWRQPEPTIGTSQADVRCWVCGADWWRDAYAFHFEEGWR